LEINNVGIGLRFWNIFCFKAIEKSVSEVGLAYIYTLFIFKMLTTA